MKWILRAIFDFVFPPGTGLRVRVARLINALRGKPVYNLEKISGRAWRAWLKKHGLLESGLPHGAEFESFKIFSGRSASELESFLATINQDFVIICLAPMLLYPRGLEAIQKGLKAEHELVYGDSDWLDFKGRRHRPELRPGFSRIFFAETWYLGDLIACRRAGLASFLTTNRAGLEALSIKAILFRYIETIPDSGIAHLPALLGSSLPESSNPGFADQSKPGLGSTPGGTPGFAGHLTPGVEYPRRSIGEFWRSIGEFSYSSPACGLSRASDGASAVSDGFFSPPIPLQQKTKKIPKTSIIIPNRDQAGLLRACLDSLYQTLGGEFEILVVENGSREPATFELYREAAQRPGFRLLEWNQPFNYAAINNFAAAQAGGELLVFLNNDTEASPGWHEALAEFALRPDVGLVGARLVYPNRRLQHAGLVLGMKGSAGHIFRFRREDEAGYLGLLAHARDAGAVTGACQMLRREVFVAIKGFDELYPIACNDVDLCLRVHAAGLRVVYTPRARLVHYESVSRGLTKTPAQLANQRREVERLQSLWGERLAEFEPLNHPWYDKSRDDGCNLAR